MACGPAPEDYAIRRLGAADREAALAVINEAARWYRDFLPPAEYHEPEMTAGEWDEEARRLTWYGVFVGGTLAGVGGLERVQDVALLRHGYVLPASQRAGLGARLVEHLEREARGVARVVVGTYRDNYKARRSLEKAGYRPSPDPEKVLRAYYSIAEDRLRSSITYEKTLSGGQAMKLRSDSFKDGDYLGTDHVLSADYGFGCRGGNRSPHLAWEGAPAGTKSFALTCFDPDAPTGSGFWHWVVVNIPPHASELPLDAGNPASGRLPAGALSVRTDFGKPGYGGPCPPEGDHPHRYLFTVHAVSMDALPVTADTSAAVVGFYLNFNTLAKASLMGLFKR